MAKKIELFDRIKCPYCGRPGIVSRLFKSIPASYNICHKVVKGKVKSEATGNLIECEITVDACYQGVRHDAWDSIAEEPFE